MKFVPYARRVKSDRLNWIWFHPSSRRIGIVHMNGFTRVVDCTEEKESANRSVDMHGFQA
jgi:hypothetical protein